MSTTTIKGARYLPKFSDPVEWDSTKEYEAIEVVQYQASTYISKQPVPAGVQIDDEEYWLLWADPNAQMEQLRQMVEPFEDISKVATKAFDTVADMKAFEGFVVGDIAHTNGFHSAGDGGAAWYEIVSDATGNEMDVIGIPDNVNPTLFATLIADDAVKLEQLGINANAPTDNADIFNYAIAHYKKISCFTDFGITSPVNISALTADSSNVRTDMEINLLCTIFANCEETYCFNVNHINRFHLNFDRVTSNKGIFNLTATHNASSGSFDTIVYLYFNSMVLNAGAGYSCINAETTGDGWINEVFLNQTRFRSGYAFSGKRDQLNGSIGPISNWHLNQIATEGVSKGVVILGDNWDIRNCRILEAGSDLYNNADGFPIKNFVIEGTYIGLTRYHFDSNASGVVYGTEFIGPSFSDYTYGTKAFSIINGKWIRIGENPVCQRITTPNGVIDPLQGLDENTSGYYLYKYTSLYSKPRFIEFTNATINEVIVDPDYYFGPGKYNELLISFPNLSGGSFNVSWEADGHKYTYDVKEFVDTTDANAGVLVKYSPYSPKEVAFIPVGRMIRSYYYQVPEQG